ncbi:DNA-binding transcriptional regulator YiaG [Bacillus luteolus]|nr:DNA-binding transcriptional regulator YiaG [Cytobacillus luteolus]
MTIRESRLSQWMVAERLGISEATFTRWLRGELPPDKKIQILKAVTSLKKEIAANGSAD